MGSCHGNTNVHLIPWKKQMIKLSHLKIYLEAVVELLLTQYYLHYHYHHCGPTLTQSLLDIDTSMTSGQKTPEHYVQLLTTVKMLLNGS